ncbi:secretory calcium-binding phosphoprotein 1 [Brachyistius frenatus]|uniref:secretory calcium-binding phosphoprotein 1 n=1 Tax=Brachyistius frenatus TaxID=100188 RepID=UPI0037E98084
MKVMIITFCLIGAVFANPILHDVVSVSSELDSNSTESVSVSQSSENETSEMQSSEETTSNQSSESESLESTSEDKTSEESNSQSDEDDGMDFMAETKDDSMGSEENLRKSWVRVFASAVKALSAEDNSSAEASNELTDKQTSTSTDTAQSNTNLQNPTDSSDSTSDSADTSEITADTSESSESTSSESLENSDSSDASKSSEDSNASDSTELEVKAADCVNGTESCESEEYFFQNIGDDGHFSVDNLMVPDEDERELNLRR